MPSAGPRSIKVSICNPISPLQKYNYGLESALRSCMHAGIGRDQIEVFTITGKLGETCNLHDGLAAVYKECVDKAMGEWFLIALGDMELPVDFVRHALDCGREIYGCGFYNQGTKTIRWGFIPGSIKYYQEKHAPLSIPIHPDNNLMFQTRVGKAYGNSWHDTYTSFRCTDHVYNFVDTYKNHLYLDTSIISIHHDWKNPPFQRNWGILKLTRGLKDEVLVKMGRHPSPVQEKEEISALLKILKRRKLKAILEIGTFTGGSLYLFTKALSLDGTIISIDLPGGRYGGGYPESKIPLYKSFLVDKQQMHLIREDSHRPSTFHTVELILEQQKLDFLFIDGDHTYEGVKCDFEMYSNLVKEGGIIAFHDICLHALDGRGERRGCEVDKFWNEIKVKYKHKEIIRDSKQTWAGIGVLYI